MLVTFITSEPRVTGTAIFKSEERISLLFLICSPPSESLPSFERLRHAKKSIIRTVSTVPKVIPVIIPADMYFPSYPFFSNIHASARPTKRRESASIICESAVGTIFSCP